MRKKTSKLRLGIVISSILIISLAFILLVFYARSKHILRRKITLNISSGMSAEQYPNDLKSLCYNIEKNVPMLYDYEKLYNISYQDTKAFYNKMLEAINSDFEYYAIVRGFLNNIPSAHMIVGFPSLSSIDEDFYSNLSKNKSFVNTQEYWFNVIHDECKKHYDEDINLLIYSYYSGEYKGIAKNSNNDIYAINNSTLLSVNDIPIDEFIKLNPMVSKLKYDHINEKPMRDTIIFNDCFGDECKIEYLDKEGKKHTKNMYYGIESEIIYSYMDYFKRIDNVTTSQVNTSTNLSNEKVDYITIGDLTITKDKENNLLIIRIDKFLSEQSNEKVIEDTILSYSQDIDNIIIDIRNNNGGYYSYYKSVLSAISNKDIEINNEVYITKESYNGIIDKKSYMYDDVTNLYKTTISEVINGKASNQKKLYLLISDATGSSADNLAYEFKKNKLGIIIGNNNTAGERDGTICLNFLDISGIYYTYTKYATINSDGNYNSVYGTAPDIYIESSVDNYFTREKILSNGEDPYTLENRLKWDNILRETIEIIKEK